MEGKKTLGRQKIPMAKIEKESSRYRTFSKRNSTLYKKASEITEKYNVDMGLILFSPTDKPYSFFHPTIDAVVDRFFSPHMRSSENDRVAIANSREKVKELKNELDELEFVEMVLSNGTDEADIEKLWGSIMKFNEEEVKELELCLNSIDLDLNNCLMQVKNDASFATQAPPEMAD